ncbi:unnamed protein product [Moneuplotes crassus]|uniref:Succinate dehydrogenase assembly factor 4, mitochondrial n=1 Tax=Euplotes crassus TaxID=5936 RepID=A0AAD1Y330_EUPCR|nr:unnamed protein product [Moneuplotes crassus]
MLHRTLRLRFQVLVKPSLRYLSSADPPKGDSKYRAMSPTMAQSFGKQFTDEEIEKYIDPRGFTKEIDMENYEEVEPNQKDGNTEKKDENNAEGYKFKHNYKYKEYGFKHKGPEPTRHGDWEIKGRCSDF